MSIHLTTTTVVAGLLASWSLRADPSPSPSSVPPVETAYVSALPGVAPPAEPPGAELTDRGRMVRGVYVPVPKARAAKPAAFVAWLRGMGATAVVLDVKDDHGRVTFTDDLPMAKGAPHKNVPNLPALVAALKQAGIYVIGRLVCFKDDQLPQAYPGTAVRDARTGKPWRDHAGFAWVDPHSMIAHEHIAQVARAAEALGVDEIQLDYMRFPVERGSWSTRFPNRVGAPERYELIAALLERVDRAIHIPLSADVFGLTAYRPGDEDGLGQSLEHMAPYLDAISPMLYVANFPPLLWQNQTPGRNYSRIHAGVEQIRRRLGDRVAVRPLLQGFSWRADKYGPSFIRNQIDASMTAGSSGFLFWNQGGDYGQVSTVWKRLEPWPAPAGSAPEPLALSEKRADPQ
ncbi:MAG: putative glycoside hydrolase [Deltaproteobacteria bacterium]|nr:putative glycoside hydrolase [Deltaproteobacteria bacterium]